MAAGIEELRLAFDRTFAAPPSTPGEAPEAFLAIRLGGQPYALRLAELAGVERRRKVVPLPGGGPGLLGIAGIRGRLVPVYGLPALLGYAAQDRREWRWMALCGSAAGPLALAFDEVEACVVASASQVRRADPEGAAREHVHEVLHSGGDGSQVRGVVSIASLISSLERTYQRAERAMGASDDGT